MKARGAAIGIAIALVLGGCSKNDTATDAPTRDAPKPETTAANPAVSVAAVQPGSALVLTADGIVGAEVGRSWSEVSREFEKIGGYNNDEFADGCDSFSHLSGKFDAMVVDNAIVRVEVTEPGVRTTKGIGVGASLAALKQAYGDQLIAEKNPFEGEDVQYVWPSKNRGLVFYMREGRVWLMAGGGEAIRYPEGCY